MIYTQTNGQEGVDKECCYLLDKDVPFLRGGKMSELIGNVKTVLHLLDLLNDA